MNRTHRLTGLQRLVRRVGRPGWLHIGLGLLAAASVSARADYNESTNFSANLAIPDGDASGVISSKIANFSITNITGLTVDLNISGTFNGDLYGFLSHQSGFSVLLNRVGRRAGNDLGYGDQGFNIKLNDNAPNGDVHTYRLAVTGSDSIPVDGPVTGLFAPDGRTTDPSVVLDTDPRTALLKAFNGLDPSGTWTLFLADVSPGGTSTLNGWGLEITGVPEPGTWALLLAGAVLLSCCARWREA